MAKQTKKGKITALYERLFHDDERAGESVSIENQKQILEDYAHKHGFQNIRHFTDDGVRGTTLYQAFHGRWCAKNNLQATRSGRYAGGNSGRKCGYGHH